MAVVTRYGKWETSSPNSIYPKMIVPWVRLSVLREFASLDTNNWHLSWEDNSISACGKGVCFVQFAASLGSVLELCLPSWSVSHLQSLAWCLVSYSLLRAECVELLCLKSLILNFRSRKGFFFFIHNNCRMQILRDFSFFRVAREKEWEVLFCFVFSCNYKSEFWLFSKLSNI